MATVPDEGTDEALEAQVLGDLTNGGLPERLANFAFRMKRALDQNGIEGSEAQAYIAASMHGMGQTAFENLLAATEEAATENSDDDRRP